MDYKSSITSNPPHSYSLCAVEATSIIAIPTNPYVDAPHGSRHDQLHIAASIGDVEWCAALLKSGEGVNTYDRNDETPLYRAVLAGKLDVTKLLMTHGATVNIINGISQIHVIHVAAKLGYSDIVTYLLNSGADIDSLNKNGMTPLHYAAAAGHVNICQLLVNREVSLNLKNSSGDTAIMLATKNNYPEVVQALLTAGADPTIPAMDGRTPLDVCSSLKIRRILEDRSDFAEKKGVKSFKRGVVTMQSTALRQYRKDKEEKSAKSRAMTSVFKT